MLISFECALPELSFLLHKHPERLHTQDSTFGRVHVFSTKPGQAVLLMEIDPLKLTRRGGGSTFALQPYVLRQRTPLCRFLILERGSQPGFSHCHGRPL